jgi:hypothetical protein
MKRIFTVLLMALAFTTYSQQVSPEIIATAGDHFHNDNISLSWTLGEPVISTFSGEYVLTQGFHQDLYIITSVDEVEITNLDIQIFPNPTPDYVNIQLKQNDGFYEECTIQLIDSKGAVLKEIKEKGSVINAKMSLQQFERANYFLRVIIYKEYKTYKIVKS